jgi:hypothetical protein
LNYCFLTTAGVRIYPTEWHNTIYFGYQKNANINADLSLYYSETGDVISLKSALFSPKGQFATVDEAKAWFTAHPTYLYGPEVIL